MKNKDELFAIGLNKFTDNERIRILKGCYRIKKKVIYQIAQNDSIPSGSIADYVSLIT